MKFLDRLRAALGLETAGTPEADPLEALDFHTPCDAGPQGIAIGQHEQCEHPAVWNVQVHRCTPGNPDGMQPLVLCDLHLAYYTRAVDLILDSGHGSLPCGKHADSVFELVQAERINK